MILFARFTFSFFSLSINPFDECQSIITSAIRPNMYGFDIMSGYRKRVYHFSEKEGKKRMDLWTIYKISEQYIWIWVPSEKESQSNKSEWMEVNGVGNEKTFILKEFSKRLHRRHIYNMQMFMNCPHLYFFLWPCECELFSIIPSYVSKNFSFVLYTFSLVAYIVLTCFRCTFIHCSYSYSLTNILTILFTRSHSPPIWCITMWL